jgi:arylsulfatase A-like enzyme
LVHVPLLVRVPGDQGTRIKSAFSLVDLAPTLLDSVGVPIPADFRGRSCWNQLRRGSRQERPAISECVYECINPFYLRQRMGSRILSVRSSRHKLVTDFSLGTEYLYDLQQDPSEKNPLALDEASDVRRKLLQQARKHVAESFQSRDLDKRIASRLREFRLELARSAAPAG